MKKTILIASLALILAACSKKEKAYDATGTFEATEVTISAEATGQLTLLSADEGQEVARGTVIGYVDKKQLELKKQQLEASLRQLDANRKQLSATRSSNDSRQLDLEKQLASIRQQIANAQREKQRFTELYNDGAVARKQVDDIVYQISVLEKQLAATEDQIRSNNAAFEDQNRGISAQIEGVTQQADGIEAQIAQIDDQIANADIVSPIMGTIIEKYVENGEFVTTGKPLLKIADTQNMFIRAYVTSSQLQDIKVGQKVKVFADYGDEQKHSYEGTVTWISNRSEFTPKTILTDDERADLVYAVKIAIKNDGYVKIGMYGEVKF
ncbi:MAG: HlyD family efflux transporter periplasmic adaptor subunit [Prevotella sp.]|nr:HlyD family efflux transporter periplasmic adaptor subunit [Prevotella sp.]